MTRTLVFIDGRVAASSTFLTGLPADAEWFVIDPAEDGIAWMQEVMANYSDLASVHILSHGAAGTMQLGSTLLDAASLPQYSTALLSMGQSLGEDGDILLYGCNIAQGAVGLQFIQSLAQITQADVAASSDVTGPQALGGDAVLEAATGAVEANSLSLDHLGASMALNTAPNFALVRQVIAITPIGTSLDIGQSVVLQPDGKILVAGYSNNSNGYRDFALVRYNADGSLDTSYRGGGKLTTAIGTGTDQANSVVLQRDGKIVVAGTSHNGSNDDFALVRYNADGSLDTSFSGDGKLTTAIGTGVDKANSVVLQPDGKILVAGTSQNGNYDDFALVRYNTNGSLDISFSSDGKVTTAIGDAWDRAHSVVLQPDGKILVAGYSNTGSNDDFALVRYNADGSLDTSFHGDGKLTTAIGTGADSGKSVVLQPDGKILVAGTSYNGIIDDFALVRYNADGSLDTSFDGDGKLTTGVGNFSNDTANSVVLQADGKIVVAGTSSSGGNADFALVRYNADGSLDTSFDGDGKLTTAIGTSTDQANSVVLQADGKIVVAGTSSSGGNADFALVRYNVDGSLDTTFSDTSSVNGAVSYVEQAVPVVLDTSVVILDAELSSAGHYGGASITLSRHGGANAEDVFSKIGNNLSTLTEGSALVRLGTIVGTVTQNSGGVLSIRFNGNATQVIVNEVLSSFAYSNTSDAPPASVQIDWTFSDGNTGAQGEGGALSTTASTTIAITAINDAPTLAVSLAPVYTDTPGDDTFSTASGSLVGSDPDSTSLVYGITGGTVTGGTVTRAGTYGTLSVDTSTGAWSYAPSDGAIEALKGNATDRFTVSVGDGVTSTTQSFDVNVFGENDLTSFSGDVSGAVSEDGVLSASGRLIASDRDRDDALFLNNTFTGGYGTFRMASDGVWTYELANTSSAVQALTAGQTVTETFTVLTYGGVTHVVTIEVAGGGNAAPSFAWPAAGILITAIKTNASYHDYGQSVVLQPDGKILVAGTSYNGSSDDFALVRYNANGSLDTSFDGDGKLTTDVGYYLTDLANSVVLQPNGKILVAGTSNSDFALVRYSADGRLDTSFSGDGKLTTDVDFGTDEANSVVLQPDGKILVAGTNNYRDFVLVRYNADGSLDTSFDGDGKLTTSIGAVADRANSVVLQSDGKILVAGYSHNSGSYNDSDFALVRYNADGSLDTSFDVDGKLTTAIGTSTDQANSVVLQPDGKILVAGTSYNGSNDDFALVRYNADGSLDTSFDGDGKLTTDVGHSTDQANSVVLQPDGKIVVAGTSRNGSDDDFALVRYNVDGSLDTSFDGDGKLTTARTDQANSVVLQPDGKIVVAGTSSNGSDDDFALVRYNVDGSLDTAFPSSVTVSAAYTEQAVAVALDTSVVISDVELMLAGNYAGSSITLSRAEGANVDDVFASSLQEPLVEGSSFSVSGTAVGTVVRASSGVLSITFNAHATQHIVNQVLSSLTYRNTSDTPPASLEVEWVFSDGNAGSQGEGGALFAKATTTVFVTPVNDAPDGSDTAARLAASETYTFTLSSFGFKDPEDGNQLTAVRIDSLPTRGALYYDGASLSGAGFSVSASEIFTGRLTYRAPNDALDGTYANLRFSVFDSDGLIDPTPNTLSFSSNTAPTGSVTISGAAIQGKTLTASHDLVDADGLGTVTFTWYASGSASPIGTGSSFTLTRGEVGSTITVVASYTDGQGMTESVTSAATLAVVNLAPELTPPPVASYTDTSVDDSFSVASGTLSASDAENDALSFGIEGGVDGGSTVSLSGLYGALVVDKATGAWTYTPHDAAMEALDSDATERFTLTVSDGLATVGQTLDVSINATVDIPALTSKYFVLAGSGANHVDYKLQASPLSLQGQFISQAGTTGVDAIHVRPGSAIDFTASGASADKVYFDGAYGDYGVSLTGSVMTLYRSNGANRELVRVGKGASLVSSDVLVFADGTVSTWDLYNLLKSGTALPEHGSETSLQPLGAAAPGSTLNATIKAFALDSGGETFASVGNGMQLIAVGGVGLDTVYVGDGSTMDATQLGASSDLVYLRGDWADYSKSLAGSVMTFSRSVNGQTETVKVIGGNGALNDKLVFADGAVLSSNAKLALSTNLNAAIETVTGYDPDTTTPGLRPTLQASALDNVSNLDVSSDIVLSYSESVTAQAGKYIRIVDDGGAGFRGESSDHSQVIEVTDSTQVSIVGGKVTLNPTFDLDLSSNYHIEIDAGAFVGQTSGQATEAYDGSTSLNFSTATPGTGSLANATTSQAMDASGAMVAGHNWLDIEGIGSPSGNATGLDLTGGDYALVARDHDAAGANGNTGYDGIALGDLNVALNNFALGDLLYIDDQGNNASALNNLTLTAVLDQGSAPTPIQFAGTSLGGLIEVSLLGSSASFDAIDALNQLVGGTAVITA